MAVCVYWLKSLPRFMQEACLGQLAFRTVESRVLPFREDRSLDVAC